MICTICNKESGGTHAGTHARWCKPNMPPVGLKINKIKICIGCKEEFSMVGYARMTPCLIKAERKYCSSRCRAHYTMTSDVREKISKSRKKYLKENPDKHPWRRKDKFISVPCEKLKESLKNAGFCFEEEWIAITSNSYSIDIAFPDIKLGIEVNGSQHYNRAGSLRPYYQSRHDKIEAEGWSLIEIHYTNCFKQKEVDRLITALKNSNAHEIKFTNAISFSAKKELAEKLQEENKVKVFEKKQRLGAERIEILKTIDLTKYGWVQKVSNSMGVSHTQAKRIVNKLLPGCDYYVRKSKKDL